MTYHGEGPVWSERRGGLRWVDMLAGDVLSLRPEGTVDRRHVGGVAAAVRPRAEGGAVIGIERGFALEDPDGTVRGLDELWAPTGASTAARWRSTSGPAPRPCTGSTPT